MKEVKWGSNKPITYNDINYKEINIICRGTVNYEIVNQELFDSKYSLVSSIYPEDSKMITNVVISTLEELIKENDNKSYLELTSLVSSDKVIEKANLKLADLGVRIDNISILGIEPTPESKEAISSFVSNSVNNVTKPVAQVEEKSNKPVTDANAKVANPKKSSGTLGIILALILLLVGAYFVYNKFFKNTNSNVLNQTESSSFSLEMKDQSIGTYNPIKYNDSQYGKQLAVLFQGKYSFVASDAKYNYSDEKIKEEMDTMFNSAFAKTCTDYLDYVSKSKSVLSIMALQTETESFDWVAKMNENLSISSEDKEKLKVTDLSIMQIIHDNESSQIVDEIIKQNINSNSSSNELVSKFTASVKLYSKEEGGRHTPDFPGATWILKIGEESISGKVKEIKDNEMMLPGESYEITVEINSSNVSVNQEFTIFENDRAIGTGKILSIN